jgi:hypothetical protein
VDRFGVGPGGSGTLCCRLLMYLARLMAVKQAL